MGTAVLCKINCFDVHHIQATESAFAAIRGDGVVVCWGNPQDGGDCTDVQEQLVDVKHVQATTKAFAAIRADKDRGDLGQWQL